MYLAVGAENKDNTEQQPQLPGAAALLATCHRGAAALLPTRVLVTWSVLTKNTLKVFFFFFLTLAYSGPRRCALACQSDLCVL